MRHSGKAEVVSGDGMEIYGTKEEGEFFGEMALITNAPRSATVRTCSEKPLEVFTLLKHDFQKVVQQFPKLRDVLDAYTATLQ